MHASRALLCHLAEPLEVRPRLESLNQEVNVIGHETVRNHRERLLARRSLELLADERDELSLDEVPCSLIRAHRQEIAIGACVIEAAEVLGIAGHGPARGNVRAT